MDFTIKEILDIFRKQLLLMIICTLTGLCGSYIISSYVIKPSYTNSVQMYVNSEETASTTNINELSYAQKVVNTYINFLQTKAFYRQVRKESGLDYSEKQLENMTNIHAVNDTEIFEISVTSDNPRVSYRLVDTMQQIVPDLIKNIKSSARISIVDPVVLSLKPSGPNVVLNTAFGGLIGIMISIISAFLIEILDVKVKNQEELTEKYKIPILGTIPIHERQQNINYKPIKFLFFRIERKNKKASALIKRDESNFFITEAYNALRMNLRFILRKEGCKKILINSPVPEEGKSTTSANIGTSIAQTGAKVLILDCDLRKGTLHQFFHTKSTPGISDILSGMKEEKEVLQETPYANLYVISLGTIPPNPAELLASNQMEELIRRLEKSYDYIILDTPPINIVADALSLVKLVDGVVIVVKENFTSHPNIVNAFAKYKFADAKLLGFVINGTSLSQGNKSRAQYYYRHRKKND